MLTVTGRQACWARQLWLLGASVGVVLAACSDQSLPESVGQASQALTATQQRILGFESVGAGSTDWTTTSGTRSQSTRHVEGAGSLAIANGGNAEIKSAALSSLGPVADKLTLDLLLPAAQPNPNWMGTLKIVIECPSQELWYEGLAEYQLQGRPTEQFLRFEFPLSASTRQKLSTGTYSDLRFKILLNVATGVGPWLLDRLWVGDPSSGGSGGAGGNAGTGGVGGSAGGGGSAGTSGSAGSSESSNRDVTFRIVTPKGVLPADVAVGATSSLRLNDGVSLRLANGTGNASAASAGNPGGSYLGVRASLLNLSSIGSVELRNEAVVWGSLTTSGVTTFEPGASVHGTRTEGASLLPRNVLSWKVSFPLPNSGSVSLEPGVTRILDPGNYGSLDVKSGAHLKLRRGTYRFEDGAIEPNGYLDIDNSAGPVFVYFRTSLLWNGITNPQRPADNVLFGVGALYNQLGSPWKGLLVANGSASLSSAQATGHEGSIFADDIVLHQWTPFRHHPFVPANFCDTQDPTECGPFCPCETGGACDSTLECQSGLTCVAGTCGGATCSADSACPPGMVCAGGQCLALCTAYPNAPECAPPHCTNGIKDDGETDIDCGGSCVACPAGEHPVCQSDADCAAPLVCAAVGASYGLNRTTRVCTLPGCLADPAATGCGPDGAPCGSCEPFVPCAASSDCPAGDVCSQAQTCVPPECITDPVGTGCGTAADVCGACPCTPSCAGKSCGDDPSDGCQGTCTGICAERESGCRSDADCASGNACIFGGGPRLGLPEGTNICLPYACVSSGQQDGVDCGSLIAPCGLCAAIPEDICAGRACGFDPTHSVLCGVDAPGCIQGKDLGAFSLADLEVETLDRGNGTVRSIEPLDAPIEDSVTVGAIQGAFEVDARGRAGYSIPIIVPPGRKGLQPQISLVYNSGKGNGLVGMGWSIDGLSAIARCAKSAATDGWAEPVKFDNSDAICLDGKRLVLATNSPQAALTVGAIYRTELDSFDKIELVGEDVDNSTSYYFRVWRKDGLIYEYGHKPNQRLSRAISAEAQVTRAWALSRIRDRVGNYLDIEYGNFQNLEARTPEGVAGDTVEFWPSSIAYGGVINPLGEVQHSRVVEFEYRTPAAHYLEGYSSNGSRIMRTRLLKTVKTRVLDQQLRSYELTYELAPAGIPVGSPLAAAGPFEVTGPERLKSVLECSQKNGTRVCKKPTTFTYSDERGFHPNTHKTTVPGGRLRGPFIDFDYNGDGARDILAQFDPDGSAGLRWVILVSTRRRFDASYEMVQPTTGGTSPQPIGIDRVCFSQASIADVDGDGRDDVLDACRKTLAYNVWMSTGDAANPLVLRQAPVNQGYAKTPRVFFVDVDGDEVKDLFECGVKSTFDATRSPNPDYVEQAVYYKGARDGTFDSVGRGATSRKGKRRGEGGLWGYCFGGPHFTVAGDPTSPMLTQDVNGDGTKDLLMYVPRTPEQAGGSLIDDSGWGRYVVTPDGETAYWLQVSGGTPSGSSPFTFVDINGDGLRDWLYVGKPPEGGANTVRVSINTGGRFWGSQFGGPNLTGGQLRLTDFMIKNGLPLDYDGDGLEDLLNPLERKSGDPAGARGLWLWNRAGSGDHGHGTLDVDLATLDLNDASKRSLEAQPQLVPPDRGTVANLADADGDGSVDLIQLASDGKVGIHYGQFGRENLLVGVADGVGQRIEISYDAQTLQSDGTQPTYRSEEGCAHAGARRTSCVKHVGPLVSVYKVIADPGDPYASSTDMLYHYRYEDAREGLYGRGWLGFKKTIIEQMDQASQVTLIRRTEIVRDNETFLSDGKLFPFAGLETSRTTTTARAQSTIELEASARRSVVEQEWEVASSAIGAPYPLAGRRVEHIDDVLASGQVIQIETRDSHVREVDGYGNVLERLDLVYVNERLSAMQKVTSEFDDTQQRVDDWLIALKTRQTTEELLFGSGIAKDYEANTVSWGYNDRGLMTETTREPEEEPDSSLYLKTTYTRQPADVFQNVRSVEQVGNWRDGPDEVIGARVTSYQYDGDGIFPRRAIQHIGLDCPLDPDLTDGDNEGIGATCLMLETKYDPRDGTLLATIDNTGVGSQSSFDSFGRGRRRVSAAQTVSVAYEEAEPKFVNGRLISGTTQKTVSNETTGKVSVETFDALGRLVQTEASGLEGVPVFQEYRYVWGSLLQAVSRPHEEKESGQGEVVNVYDDRYLCARWLDDGVGCQQVDGLRAGGQCARGVMSLEARA